LSCLTATPPSLQLQPDHSPNGVADIVGHQQCTLLVDRYADRTSHRVATLADEASEDVDRWPGRLAAFERYKNDLITTTRIAIPGTVLSDKHPVRELRR
jgi:hypothetical protein